MTQTPAGWYPDPYGSPQLRWWDGTQWTDATHPLESPAGQGGPVTTGQWAQPGVGTQPGTGAHPQPGTGPNPQPGTGPQPQPGTGPQFQPGTGPQFQPGTGPQFQPGTGAYPQPGTGQGPQPGTGSHPQPGTGPYAQPAPPQGQGPYPQQGPAQFAPPAQQGTAPLGAPGSPYGGPAGPRQWGNQGGTAQFPVPEFGPQGPPPPKKSMIPWVIGGGAVVILLVVALVIGISVVNRDSDPIAAGTPAPTNTVEPSDPQVTPPLETTPTPDPSSTDLPAELPQPKGNVISDPRTGLSYVFPGSKWTVPTWAELNGTGPEDPNFPQWSSGFEAVSQENFDGQDHNWVGQVLTCRLPEAFSYSGPQDLRNVAGTVLVNYEKLFYSPPHKRKIVKDAALDVSGKKAWILRFEMDFTGQAKKSGWKFKKEQGVILVVDQGSGQRPSMLYASVPDNLDTSVIDRVLDSLKAS
ncbi:DUF2510 domain-containing protein [Sphaerisporangium sp. NPDC088356]|uniref:DUF2510 domain-containing protein n=1 Tax=Sphaerisporangium sp. NPDC088356 TaxID=3154871 RepID=UPI0034225ECF